MSDNSAEFKTFYGKYIDGFLILEDKSIIMCIFYGIQNDQQYINKYIYVGGTLVKGALLVQEVVV